MTECIYLKKTKLDSQNVVDGVTTNITAYTEWTSEELGPFLGQVSTVILEEIVEVCFYISPFQRIVVHGLLPLG